MLGQLILFYSFFLPYLFLLTLKQYLFEVSRICLLVDSYCYLLLILLTKLKNEMTMMQRFSIFLAAWFCLLMDHRSVGFSKSPRRSFQTVPQLHNHFSPLFLTSDKDETVVELGDDNTVEETKNQKVVVAPFISQGEELAEGVLNPDLSDPKQARVIFYTLISLLPVLFLIPFMISREFIPADMLPPVEMN